MNAADGREARRGLRRRIAFAIAGAAMLLLLGAMLAMVMWPRASARVSIVALASLEPGVPVYDHDHRVFIVRLDDDRVLAFSEESPHLPGDPLRWVSANEMRSAGWPNPRWLEESPTGVFVEPRHGETFAGDGTRIFGPAPRDMDQYAVSIEDNWVVVDLSKLIPGSRTPGASSGATTPTPAATVPPPPSAPPPVPTPARAPAQPWRQALANERDVVALVDAILAGPDHMVELTARVQALCSFHGELNSACREQGLGIYDSFEAVVVTDFPSFCEGCELTPERLREALEHIWRDGGTSIASFYSGTEPSDQHPGQTPAGVELVAVWKVDEATEALVAQGWPSLTASYALGFRAVTPAGDDEAVTGFLLLVDPTAERPIAVVLPLSTQWTAQRAAAYAGRGEWEVLYLP